MIKSWTRRTLLGLALGVFATQSGSLNAADDSSPGQESEKQEQQVEVKQVVVTADGQEQEQQVQVQVIVEDGEPVEVDHDVVVTRTEESADGRVIVVDREGEENHVVWVTEDGQTAEGRVIVVRQNGDEDHEVIRVRPHVVTRTIRVNEDGEPIVVRSLGEEGHVARPVLIRTHRGSDDEGEHRVEVIAEVIEELEFDDDDNDSPSDRRIRVERMIQEAEENGEPTFRVRSPRITHAIGQDGEGRHRIVQFHVVGPDGEEVEERVIRQLHRHPRIEVDGENDIIILRGTGEEVETMKFRLRQEHEGDHGESPGHGVFRVHGGEGVYRLQLHQHDEEVHREHAHSHDDDEDHAHEHDGQGVYRFELRLHNDEADGGERHQHRRVIRLEGDRGHEQLMELFENGDLPEEVRERLHQHLQGRLHQEHGEEHGTLRQRVRLRQLDGDEEIELEFDDAEEAEERIRTIVRQRLEGNEEAREDFLRNLNENVIRQRISGDGEVHGIEMRVRGEGGSDDDDDHDEDLDDRLAELEERMIRLEQKIDRLLQDRRR